MQDITIGWDVISLFGWDIELSFRKKSGTNIHHGLRRLPNTNKNATPNQKHAGLMGKR
jgi:hypothetical protein